MLHKIQAQPIRNFSMTAVKAKVWRDRNRVSGTYEPEAVVLANKGQYKIYPHKIFCKLLFDVKKQNPFLTKPRIGNSYISLSSIDDRAVYGKVPNSKRRNVLNKLFMRYIPEVMSTSHISDEIFDLDVTISDVEIAPSLQVIHVYWVPKGTEEDAHTEEVLNKIAYPLRNELIKLRLIGLVPPIVFRKNKRLEYMQRIEHLLAIADYGENHVRLTADESELRKELQLDITLPKEIKDQIAQIEMTEMIDDEEEVPVPTIRVDALGLNRQNILNKVFMGMNNKKILSCGDNENSKEFDSILENYAVSKTFTDAIEGNENWNRAAFRDYLKRQKMDKRKLFKVQQREALDCERKLATEPLGEVLSLEDELYQEFYLNAYPDEDVQEEISQ